MGNDRDQFPPRRDGFAPPNPGYRPPPPAPMPERYPPPREEFASDQVKDLLELYFRDPQAFDQYAKTYYYGERMERVRAYYDRRPPDAAYAQCRYLCSQLIHVLYELGLLQHALNATGLSLSLSLHYNGRFSRWPRLAGTRMPPFSILLELRAMEVVVATGAIKRTVKIQSLHHHQQTST